MAPLWCHLFFNKLYNIFMQLDRTIAPTINQFQEITIPGLTKKTLANGLEMFVVNAGAQPVARLELVFEAGNKYEKQTGESYFTSKMLLEGTTNFTSAEIAEKFAAIGYFIEITQGTERANITLNGLVRHLQVAINLVLELIQNPRFPVSELDNLKRIAKQSLAINQEKTSYLASVAFKENIFGLDNYIGKTMDLADIERITPENLINFYENNFKNKPFKIFASGKIENDETEILSDLFSKLAVVKAEKTENIDINFNYFGKKIIVEKADALQSSIRIGRRIVPRSHPDYFGLKVCNTILGGFFGSRLMKNIREEKGYTYGISSSYLAIPHYGYLMIGTDVKKEFTQNTIDEIFKEINILQTTLVEESELSVVKNFLIGDFAGSLNTPFDILEKHKLLILENLQEDYYSNYVKNINSVSSIQIIEMAQKYFSKENMLEIVVGGK